MSRVLLIHTGGTLGMTGTPLEPGAYADAIAQRLPELNELAELDTRIPFNLDSSDVGPAHWTELAELIAETRETYDGFVVVHGTDTMAYTASALSFALRGLDCPVVLTGAQRPLAALRTDARRNLADAVETATCDVPEVAICFDGLLLRGVRATKTNVRDYRAFESPGCEPLARLGVDIEFGDHIRRPTGTFAADSRFDSRVYVVHAHPGLEPSVLEAMLEADDRPRGFVLAAFGVGTIPTETRPLAPVVAEATDRGLDVLVVTQSSGKVDLDLYENSIALRETGAISGGEMGIEAAVTKLMHALAKFDDGDDRRDYLRTDIAGELA
ncbi:MAG: asparaginase [Bradymonadaceae bacterium]